ncbi:hypothetical protein BN13_2050001 [Nostocoides jenkinsii Ben 74]|uniref:Uncharacterized protein n=1 Tax=Nostocoides jenkinsii Ben 74 TaxID=1193518 RepID=A0A077MD26_9MICO|nr:hypothetical protein BN13_2050001 [Tetrasphaera jenkinsii Ben 74]
MYCFDFHMLRDLACFLEEILEVY